MTTEEFSNEFDTMLNSYALIFEQGKTNTPITIELDEYEKSVFLTDAQEIVVTNLLVQASFEETELIRRYLSSLIKTEILTNENSNKVGISTNYSIFTLPSDVLAITYEAVVPEDSNLECFNNTDIEVIPVTQDEYHRLKKNPFRGIKSNRALRLDLEDNQVEIAYKYNIKEYKIRYITKPQPIILTNLTDNLSINGITRKTECKLNPAIHRDILKQSVQLVLQSKILGRNINNNN